MNETFANIELPELKYELSIEKQSIIVLCVSLLATGVILILVSAVVKRAMN